MGKKFDFKGLDNAIPLQKKRLKYEISGHANHPDYDNAIDEKITEIMMSSSTQKKAFEEIQELIQKSKDILEKEVLLGTKDVNQITKF